MKVEGTRTFDAPRETVWGVLNDPSQMAKLMPGVESFDVADDRHWKANVKIPLGLGGLKMSINFEKLEEREPTFARLRAKGTGVGAMMNMETQFDLSEAGAGTEMKWAADVKIAGPVGSMGQRVLQPIVNQQVSNVMSALDKQVMEAKGASGGEVLLGATPGGGDPLAAGPAEAGTGASSGTSGTAGTPQPTTEREPPATDPELKDAGEPPRSSPSTEPEEGTSGAEEGLSPFDPESYSSDPEGPRTSTEDTS